MQTFRGCLPAVSFTIRGYMNANLDGKRRADTSRTFRQLLFRTQEFCMVLANVKRTASSALPACHQGTSVFAVESVVRRQTLGGFCRREPPRSAFLAMKATAYCCESQFPEMPFLRHYPEPFDPNLVFGTVTSSRSPVLASFCQARQRLSKPRLRRMKCEFASAMQCCWDCLAFSC